MDGWKTETIFLDGNQFTLWRTANRTGGDEAKSYNLAVTTMLEEEDKNSNALTSVTQ